MLWRPGYENRELLSVRVPELAGRLLSGEPLSLEDGLLIGGFDLRAQIEIGVWRRLLDRQKPLTVFMLEVWTQGNEASLRSMTPPSLQNSVGMANVSEAWLDLIRPDRPERAFAGLVRDGAFEVLMIGIPTEEAWDRFQARLTG